MTSPKPPRHVLIERVHELVEEALHLPYGASSFARREEIDWELLQLFRQIGTLSDGPLPYWIQEEARRLRLSERLSDRPSSPGHKEANDPDATAYSNIPTQNHP